MAQFSKYKLMIMYKTDRNEFNYDSQGWPLFQLTIKEILKQIGFTENTSTNKLEIDLSDKVLDKYPRILEDDGMGYGVNPKYIYEADKCSFDDDSLNPYVNMFVETELSHIDKWKEIKAFPGYTIEIDGVKYYLLKIVKFEGEYTGIEYKIETVYYDGNKGKKCYKDFDEIKKMITMKCCSKEDIIESCEKIKEVGNEVIITRVN